MHVLASYYVCTVGWGGTSTFEFLLPNDHLLMGGQSAYYFWMQHELQEMGKNIATPPCSRWRLGAREPGSQTSEANHASSAP